jgi:hypothetical protein
VSEGDRLRLIHHREESGIMLDIITINKLRVFVGKQIVERFLITLKNIASWSSGSGYSRLKVRIIPGERSLHILEESLDHFWC